MEYGRVENIRRNDRNLAESLIERLGSERALRLARLNRWYGVVEAIQRLDNSSVVEVAAFRAGFRRHRRLEKETGTAPKDRRLETLKRTLADMEED